MTDPATALIYRLVRDGQPPGTTWPRTLSALIESFRAADVVGLAARDLLRGGPDLDGLPLTEDVRRTLEHVVQTETRHHGFHFAEAARLTGLLEARGVPCLVLKGVALARSVYDHPCERAFRDLDLLVAPDRLETALDVLRSSGYVEACPPKLWQAYRDHHFHVPFEAFGRPRVEVHWALTRPDDPYRLDAEDLLADRTVPEDRPSFPCASSRGQVLHCATSLLRCGFTDLKRLVDLDRLVRFAPPDWRDLRRMAEPRGLAPAVRLALELCSELFATPVADVLPVFAPLGHARRRLDDLGIRGFPAGLPPSGWGPARHLVRFWLVPHRAVIVRQFFFRPRVERARLDAFDVPWQVRAKAGLKRTILLALLAAWQMKLAFFPHRLPPLSPAAAPPSSVPPAGDTAGTPARPL